MCMNAAGGPQLLIALDTYYQYNSPISFPEPPLPSHPVAPPPGNTMLTALGSYGYFGRRTSPLYEDISGTACARSAKHVGCLAPKSIGVATVPFSGMLRRT